VFYNENTDDNSSPFGNSKYSENTKFNMDKESLALIIEAYNESKKILNENKDLLFTMTELLLNNTVLSKNDIPHYFF